MADDYDRPLRFRCYIAPCHGGWRDDTTWMEHFMAEHHQQVEAIAKAHRQGVDLVPFIDRSGDTASGRAAFLAERRRMADERGEG